MIIGIDISSTPYGTGVSNYTFNLVKNLLEVDKENFYKLFFSSLRQPLPKEIADLPKVYPNVKIYQFPYPPTLLIILWNKLHIFPIEWFIGKVDIFHTWDWLEPPAIFAKKISTVHDLVPFLYPEWQHPRTISTFKDKFYWSVKESQGFICVSQNSKSDFLKLFPQVSSEKIIVIPEAADNKYFSFHSLSKNIRIKKIEDIKKKYHLKRFILTQGTREPRKNLSRLIKAFIQYKTDNPQSTTELVITGKYGWGEELKQKRLDIKILGYIPETDIVALHAAAICLVYPSLYEGFGLPVLKSMTVGVPVIAGNVSSFPEVAGNAALLVDPSSIMEIKNAIEKILKSSPERNKLIKRGLIQSKKFSWENTAKSTLNFYQLVSQNKL